MGLFKKVCRLHNGIFDVIQLCRNFTLPYPLRHSLRNYRIRGKKILCIYGSSAYHVISTEVENHIFKSIEFLDTSAFINNAHCQSSRILISLCKYCIVISDTVEGFFLDVQFLLLDVILSELHEKPRRRD